MAFFVSYILLAGYFLLNIIVAVLLDEFVRVSKQQKQQFFARGMPAINWGNCPIVLATAPAYAADSEDDCALVYGCVLRWIVCWGGGKVDVKMKCLHAGVWIGQSVDSERAATASALAIENAKGTQQCQVTHERNTVVPGVGWF